MNMPSLAACLIAGLLNAAHASAATDTIAPHGTPMDTSRLQDWTVAAIEGEGSMAAPEAGVGARPGQPVAPANQPVAKVQALPAPVPEPATLSMFVIGLGILAFSARSTHQSEKFEA